MKTKIEGRGQWVDSYGDVVTVTRVGDCVVFFRYPDKDWELGMGYGAFVREYAPVRAEA
jgi:hypothetical protein